MAPVLSVCETWVSTGHGHPNHLSHERCNADFRADTCVKPLPRACSTKVRANPLADRMSGGVARGGDGGQAHWALSPTPVNHPWGVSWYFWGLMVKNAQASGPGREVTAYHPEGL